MYAGVVNVTQFRSIQWLLLSLAVATNQITLPLSLALSPSLYSVTFFMH